MREKLNYTFHAHTFRVRLGVLSLAMAGILFVLYPAIRPFSDETSLQGAEAFASNAWILAHVLAILGFILVALGLLALYISLQATSVERLAFRALVLSWIGIGLALPFYGGEAFGLHAIGEEAVRQQSAALVALANDVRSGPQLILFVVGLAVLALGAILAALAVWRSHTLPKWSGTLFALGFALFLPQFFWSQPLRVAHGVLVCAGCLWLAAGMWRMNDQE